MSIHNHILLLIHQAWKCGVWIANGESSQISFPTELYYWCKRSLAWLRYFSKVKTNWQAEFSHFKTAAWFCLDKFGRSSADFIENSQSDEWTTMSKHKCLLVNFLKCMILAVLWGKKYMDYGMCDIVNNNCLLSTRKFSRWTFFFN